MLHEIRLLLESLGSKYSFLPSSTFESVIGSFGSSISFIKTCLFEGIASKPAFFAFVIKDSFAKSELAPKSSAKEICSFFEKIL